MPGSATKLMIPTSRLKRRWKKYSKNTCAPEKPSDWETSYTKKYSQRNKGPAANAHQFSAPNRDNVKFVSPDGKMEAIYDATGTLVTDPRDVGTYNYSPFNGTIKSAIGHYVKDVKPWIRWGNSPDDTTSSWQRMWGLLRVY